MKNFVFPKRNELIKRLKNEEFDVLIIGGGATGAGVAYAASSYGLKVALVERNDYSSETSSKSTKMIHGGLRYLHKAISRLDYSEFELVTESLNERKLLLRNCPNMVNSLPILLPCTGFRDFFFQAFGLALYELISLDRSMMPKYASKKKITELFPYMDMNKFSNGIIYYDGKRILINLLGQFDDSRLNVTVIKTAIAFGAAACNYVNAEKLVTAISMQRKNNRERHWSMPKYLTEKGVGILITEPNNRVLFMVPWEGTTLVGTSDSACSIVEKLAPTMDQLTSLL
ncbi:hypothetical protein HZS_1081, partial [Henneguya salminicola]